MQWQYRHSPFQATAPSSRFSNDSSLRAQTAQSMHNATIIPGL